MQVEVTCYLFFQVHTADETTFVGRVTKQWTGLGKELFTDADNFGISFPIDLDIKMKAVMIGVVFLLVSILNFLIFYSTHVLLIIMLDIHHLYKWLVCLNDSICPFVIQFVIPFIIIFSQLS